MIKLCKYNKNYRYRIYENITAWFTGMIVCIPPIIGYKYSSILMCIALWVVGGIILTVIPTLDEIRLAEAVMIEEQEQERKEKENQRLLECDK